MPTCPLCAARALACDGDCLATLHKSGGPKECGNEPAQSKATGPRTAEGKAVAARNATTHGLFYAADGGLFTALSPQKR